MNSADNIKNAEKLTQLKEFWRYNYKVPRLKRLWRSLDPQSNISNSEIP